MHKWLHTKRVLFVDQFLVSPRIIHICVVDGWCWKCFFFCLDKHLHAVIHYLSLRGWTPKEVGSRYDEGANWLLFWHCCCFKLSIAVNSLCRHFFSSDMEIELTEKNVLVYLSCCTGTEGVLDESAGTPVNVAIATDIIISRHNIFMRNSSKCGVVSLTQHADGSAISQSWAVRENLWHLWLESCAVLLAAFQLSMLSQQCSLFVRECVLIGCSTKEMGGREEKPKWQKWTNVCSRKGTHRRLVSFSLSPVTVYSHRSFWFSFFRLQMQTNTTCWFEQLFPLTQKQNV